MERKREQRTGSWDLGPLQQEDKKQLAKETVNGAGE